MASKIKLTIIDTLSLKSLLSDITQDKECTPLSAEQELALFKQYNLETNLILKQKIKQRILKSNLRYCITYAKKYYYEKFELNDIINEAVIGMSNAFEKYDINSGNRFLTYAKWYMQLQLNGFLNNVVADISQPLNRFRIKQLITKSIKNLKNIKDEEFITIEDIVEEYSKIKEKQDPVLTRTMFSDVLNLSKNFISLNKEIGGNNSSSDEIILEDIISSEKATETDFNLNNESKQYKIKQILNLLDSRSQTIVEMNFGLNGQEELTLDQISDKLSLTRERVGQLLTKAIEKLKENSTKIKNIEILDNTTKNEYCNVL